MAGGRTAMHAARMQNIAPKRLSDRTIMITAAANNPQYIRPRASDRTRARNPRAVTLCAS